MHGQEIADELAKRRGDKPSPGTIYPALKSLKYAGFLREEEKVGKTITYSLTPRGMKAFHIAKRRFTRTFLGVPVRVVTQADGNGINIPRLFCASTSRAKKHYDLIILTISSVVSSLTITTTSPPLQDYNSSFLCKVIFLAK